MKNILLKIFTFFVLIVNAQPVPKITINNKNLNDISIDLIEKCLSSRCALDTIVIDKTTNLNDIEKISQFKYLDLKVDLTTFPRIISSKNWKTEVLNINGNNTLKDLSTLNELAQLKKLYVHNFDGEIISKTNLDSKNLNTIGLYNTPNLKDISSLKDLEGLRELNICTTNSIQYFPRFKQGNQLEDLCIVANGNLTNIKYLKKLKKLALDIKINSLPNYLPKNLSELRINGRNQSILKNINALNRYTNLQLLSFGNLTIKDSISTFPKIELNELNFGGKEIGNISFILKFKKIKNLDIYDLDGAYLANNSTYSYSTIFENVKILSSKSVDYSNLFLLPITNSLSIQFTDIETLPNIEYLKKIPSVLIENNPKLLQEDYILSNKWKINNNGK